MAFARDRQQKSQQEEALLQDAVLGLTPARELVRYYESSKDWKSLDALTLWFIGEHPDIRENWGARPAWDQIRDSEGYNAPGSSGRNNSTSPGTARIST